MQVIKDEVLDVLVVAAEDAVVATESTHLAEVRHQPEPDHGL